MSGIKELMQRQIKLTEKVKDRVMAKRLPYAYDELEPVLSEENVRVHYEKHTQQYARNINGGKETPFNKNGLALHDLWWSLLRAPQSNNTPTADTRKLIEDEFGTWTEFKKQWTEVALGIQGSGWVALTKDLEIIEIYNHDRDALELVLILDVWEHSHYLTYPGDRSKYIAEMWKLYNWDKVEDLIKGRNRTARKLADWWEDHKAVDEKRVRKELEELESKLESELEIQQDRLEDATTKLNQLEDEVDALREVLRNTYGDYSQ